MHSLRSKSNKIFLFHSSQQVTVTSAWLLRVADVCFSIIQPCAHKTFACTLAAVRSLNSLDSARQDSAPTWDVILFYRTNWIPLFTCVQDTWWSQERMRCADSGVCGGYTVSRVRIQGRECVLLSLSLCIPVTIVTFVAIFGIYNA
jgi:hypothetical protein